ncbi:MAG: protease modulator HflC [Lachnospiraceae bacterium]|nr:protease modulator HflC [Lachnospiraceae bacterium]MBR4780873.1 protease modulator HflC [Lachnospiraceae bacterium]MBR6474324.1 protease modulator HflC [Lachnospiraceae bacterium]
MSEYNNEKNAGEEKVERIRQPKSKTPLIVIAIIAFIAVVVLLNSMVITKENEYTLIKQFGKVEKIVPNAGLSFMIPFIQTTDTLPKTMLLYDLTASDVITQDKKTMVVDSYVLWKITDPLKFTQTLTNITNAEGRINTIVYNSMKNIISSMSQSEVISSRDGALSQAIMQNIGTSVEQYGIQFVSIETKHLDLPSDNKAAVYERMISERNNIAASYTANGESEAKMIRTKTDNEIVVSVSEAEAQAEKIIAEGEAEYMKILSEAYNTPDRAEFYTFVRALDAAKKSMKGDKTLILPKDSPLAELFIKVE